MKVLGMLLIIIGFVMFIIKGIRYNKKEKVIDTGNLEISKKEHKTITWPYYAAQ
jgi:hypothetical protein